MSDLPGFYAIIHTLIAEIAKEEGREPEEVKAAILTKIHEDTP